MSIDRAGIHFGSLTITFFGLLLIAGLLAGGLVSGRAARRRDENPEHVIDALTWAVLAGVVGARLFHVFSPPPSMVSQGLTTSYYLTHPFDLQNGPLAIWAGGLNVVGALVGGLFGLWHYTRRQQLDFPLWADIAALGLPLGIAIGSLGNLIHGQMLGGETSLPWGVTRLVGSMRYHPTPAYLSLWSLLVLAALHWVELRLEGPKRAGTLFLWFVVLFAPGLFLFEMFQTDKRLVLAGLSVMQVTALLILIAGLLWLGAVSRRVSSATESA